MKRVPLCEPSVNRRRYDASARLRRAAETRARIVDGAADRFLRDGYAETTIAQLARDAGVSVDTIYKGFGGKPGLVRAVYQRALEGAGTVPAEIRSDALHDTERDPRRIIDAWGRFVAEIAPLAAPIAAMIAAAATTDPDVRPLIAEIDAQRLERMTLNAQRLADAGHLRPDVTVAHAADVLWTYSSAELYDLLVVRRRMPLAAYARFVSAAIAAALLPTPDARVR
jgi:AcrR family transcriptional regulator